MGSSVQSASGSLSKSTDSFKDKHDSACSVLKSVAIQLMGGHYEPASDRDIHLATQLANLLQLHGVSVYSKN